jgi:predicted nucleotidyltransferase
MELSHTLQVVTSALDGDVLQALARADAAFSGRQVARMIGASKEGTRHALARLVQRGVVVQEAAGAARMYRLNRDHLAAPAILTLAGLREELLRRMRDMLADWHPPACYAALSGSAARGQERPDSDVDVFLLRLGEVDADHAEWATQVDDLAARVSGWTGNDTRILQLGLEEIGSVDRPGGVLDDILRDGIPLAGSEAILRRALRSLRSSR